MKPFRIYEVVAGGLERVRKGKINHDYIDLESAESALHYLLITKWKYYSYLNRQFAIQDYSKHPVTIVKLETGYV